MFKVPLDAWIQANEGARIRRYAGLFEFDHFLFMLMASGVFWGMTMLFDTKYVFIFSCRIDVYDHGCFVFVCGGSEDEV